MNVFSVLAVVESEGTPIAATNLSVHSAIASIEGMANNTLPTAWWQSHILSLLLGEKNIMYIVVGIQIFQ